MGLVKSEVVTASTIVLRTNVANKPYDDKKVRKALQLAVDNADRAASSATAIAGTPAENHHVCPIHPEYVELPKVPRDPRRPRR
jgi:peptide/nickel transport system substrate-binding protein